MFIGFIAASVYLTVMRYRYICCSTVRSVRSHSYLTGFNSANLDHSNVTKVPPCDMQSAFVGLKPGMYSLSTFQPQDKGDSQHTSRVDSWEKMSFQRPILRGQTSTKISMTGLKPNYNTTCPNHDLKVRNCHRNVGARESLINLTTPSGFCRSHLGKALFDWIAWFTAVYHWQYKLSLHFTILICFVHNLLKQWSIKCCGPVCNN